jgi:hypothetical protein
MKRSRTFLAAMIPTAMGIIFFVFFPVSVLSENRDFSPKIDSTSIARIFSAITKKGRINEGIRHLENLRTSGMDDEIFLEMYARYVFEAFMPAKSDSFSNILRDSSQIQHTDTAFPCAFSWRIINSQQAQLPFFEYQAGFVLRKQFKLIFPPLTAHSPGEAWLRYRDRQPTSPMAMGLIRQLSDRIDSAWCTIHIDLSDTKISAYEYIIKRISGIYDSIEVRSDLSKYHAISLRCYRWGFFVKPEGTYTAYILFDRNMHDFLKKTPVAQGKRAPTLSGDGNVRFTLTMRCGRDVQDQAEAKLQSMLQSF